MSRRAPRPLAQRGISTYWLASQPSDSQFAFGIKNSNEILQQIVLPMTAQLQCPFVDLLPPEASGPADLFVSYSWEMGFHTLQNLIYSHLYGDETGPLLLRGADQKKPEKFVWIDIFAVHQHPGAGKSADLKALPDVIREAKLGTLFLYGAELRADKGHLRPIRRIWCLFEVWQTVRQRNSDALTFAVPHISSTRPYDFFVDYLEISLERACATVPGDIPMILGWIKASNRSQAQVEDDLRACLAAVGIKHFVNNFTAWSGYEPSAPTGRNFKIARDWVYFLMFVLMVREKKGFNADKWNVEPTVNAVIADKSVLTRYAGWAEAKTKFIQGVEKEIARLDKEEVDKQVSGDDWTSRSIAAGRIEINCRTARVRATVWAVLQPLLP